MLGASLLMFCIIKQCQTQWTDQSTNAKYITDVLHN